MFSWIWRPINPTIDDDKQKQSNVIDYVIEYKIHNMPQFIYSETRDLYVHSGCISNNSIMHASI